MFGIQLLDVAIGLAFTYTVLSLLTSAVVEALEAGLRTRAKYLWQGIGELLQDPSARTARTRNDDELPRNGSLTTLYEHPLIASLYFGDYQHATGRMFRRRLPSYIPRSNFAAALIEILSRDTRSPELSTIESFRRGVARLDDGRLRTALEAILAVAGDDLSAVQQSLEGWYDSAMDRVSGWYKRHAQVMLLTFGFGVALMLNANTFTLVQYLTQDEPARTALVQAAGSFVSTNQGQPLPSRLEDIDRYVQKIKAQGSPIGKTPPEWSRRAVVGCLVTAVAISLGAPFWFDILNRLSVVRATVKPREKSGDEAPEERPAPTFGSTPRKPTSFVMRA